MTTDRDGSGPHASFCGDSLESALTEVTARVKRRLTSEFLAEAAIAEFLYN